MRGVGVIVVSIVVSIVVLGMFLVETLTHLATHRPFGQVSCEPATEHRHAGDPEPDLHYRPNDRSLKGPAKIPHEHVGIGRDTRVRRETVDVGCKLHDMRSDLRQVRPEVSQMLFGHEIVETRSKVADVLQKLREITGVNLVFIGCSRTRVGVRARARARARARVRVSGLILVLKL